MVPRLIGMLHLPPLPGSPGYGGSRSSIRERLLEDARILEDSGFDALLMENYGDTPFYASRVPLETVAEMTALACDLRGRTSLPFGLQILRNDAPAALAVASAAGAAFIRVNVLIGAMLTDQGVIEGEAARLMRDRARSSSSVSIYADVLVKHATPLAERALEDLVEDTVHRGRADAVIVSGTATGKSVDLQRLRTVASASHVPVIVGSGVTLESIGELALHAQAFIVGTSIKREGITTNPVDPKRAAALASRCAELSIRES